MTLLLVLASGCSVKGGVPGDSASTGGQTYAGGGSFGTGAVGGGTDPETGGSSGAPSGTAGATGTTCANVAASNGWQIFFCDQAGEDRCGGRGEVTDDCVFCCPGATCHDIAVVHGWTSASCEVNGNGACDGQGDPTTDCDHCCAGSTSGGGGSGGSGGTAACKNAWENCASSSECCTGLTCKKDPLDNTYACQLSTSTGGTGGSGGTSGCTDSCSAGSFGCVSNTLGWKCVKGSNGCYAKQTQNCKTAQICFMDPSQCVYGTT